MLRGCYIRGIYRLVVRVGVSLACYKDVSGKLRGNYSREGRNTLTQPIVLFLAVVWRS